MTVRSTSASIATAAAFLLAGCAGSIASYPSLAPRPIERSSDAEPVAVAGTEPLDPAIPPRAAALVLDASRGNDAFEAAIRSNCAAVARRGDGAEGSEAWVSTQQALSAIEVARVPTTAALDDLDALAIEQAQLGENKNAPVDLTPLTDAVAQVAAMDANQRERLASLRASGCRP